MTVLALPLIAAALLARDGVADERWIIEPGPEAADAQKQGAADVANAQALAKAKRYKDAVAVLEQLSRRLPAAVHDCNLALAYLRDKRLTRAQLIWDLSGLRNGTRPKWCTGDVYTQISTALRDAGFVPTTIEVVPPEAEIEVGDVTMRNMRIVWLPPGKTTVVASAPGMVAKTVTEPIVAPSTRIRITLEPPVQVATIDAGVEPMAPQDAAPVATAPADATTVATQPEVDPLITVGGSPVGYRVGSLSVAVLGWISAGVFGYLTYDAKQDANSVYVSDPEFASAKNKYDTMKWATVASVGVGAVATALTVYFFTREDKVIPKPGRIQVGFDEGSFGVSFSGSFR